MPLIEKGSKCFYKHLKHIRKSDINESFAG